MYKYSFIALVLTVLFSACTIKPEPIQFGQDVCHFCEMTIVDKMHASEYVTPKGKIFKYDAIECMIQDLNNNNFPDRAFTLVSDFGKEGKFTNAEDATYLVSENIKSPMGEFLSAFSSKEKATAIQREQTGEMFLWKEIVNKLKK